MQSGRLRHRIVIQRATETQDTSGDPVATWATHAAVYAEVLHEGGSERFIAQRERADSGAMFKVRKNDQTEGVTSKDRVVYDGRNYDIEGIPADPDGRGRELIIQAVHRG